MQGLKKTRRKKLRAAISGRPHFELLPCEAVY
jgi:hypothetical protein